MNMRELIGLVESATPEELGRLRDLLREPARPTHRALTPDDSDLHHPDGPPPLPGQKI